MKTFLLKSLIGIAAFLFLVDPVAAQSPKDVADRANAGSVASLVVKATPGTLFRVQVFSSVAGFIHVFDAVSLPSNGAVPVIAPVAVAAGTTSSTLDLGARGARFNTGIVVAKSTTAATLTIGGSDSIYP
jgi:hypothetical protein